MFTINVAFICIFRFVSNSTNTGITDVSHYAVNKVSKCFTIVHTIYAQKLSIYMFKHFSESLYLSVSAILCLEYNLYINHKLYFKLRYLLLIF